MTSHTYLPIDPNYFDLFEEEIQKGDARVIYFDSTNHTELKEAAGKILKIGEKENSGYFLFFENGDEVRVDRIIVFNGKTGPAYDEYDAYALAPLTCKAGYEDDC